MKKITLFILLSLSFISCLNQNNEKVKTLNEAEKIGQNPNLTNNNDTKFLSQDGPLGPFPDPVVITTWYHDSEYKKKMADSGIEENRWVNLISEKLNLRLTNLWTADETNFYRKIQSSIENKTLPDYMPHLEYNLWYRMASKGLLADIRQPYEKYASPLLRTSVEYYLDSSKSMLYQDGKMYGLGVPYDGMYQMYLGWVRKDWILKKGYEIPKNSKEFFELIEKFKNDDPDGNGKDDTIGLALNNINSSFFNGLTSMSPIFQMYNAFPESWIIKDGQIVYGALQDEIIEPLIRLQNMYADGLISKDFYTYKNWDLDSIILNPKAGACIAPPWFADNIGPIGYKIDGAEWIPIELTNIDGDKKLTQFVKIDFRWIDAMRYDAPNLESIIKINNLILENANSDFVFIKNDSYGDFVEDRKFENIGGFYPIFHDSTPKEISYALENGDADFIKSQKTKYFYNQILKYLNGNKSFIGTYATRGPNGSFELGNRLFFDEKTYIFDAYLGPETKIMSENLPLMKEKKTEVFIQVIKGELSPNEGLRILREHWYNHKGDIMTEQVNNWYKKNSI